MMHRADRNSPMAFRCGAEEIRGPAKHRGGRDVRLMQDTVQLNVLTS